jgi:hypothetical protein
VRRTGPIGGLMDPRFQYVDAASTDIRQTYERVRREGWLFRKAAP